MNHCVSCHEQYDVNFIFDSKDPVPRCPKCGKVVRPEVTLYGEYLPQPAYSNAIGLINSADCLIIGGTSLEVAGGGIGSTAGSYVPWQASRYHQ